MIHKQAEKSYTIVVRGRTDNGKEIKIRRTCATLTAAKEAEKVMQAELDLRRGNSAARSSLTFKDIVEHYNERTKPKFVYVKRILERMAEDLGDVPMDQLQDKLFCWIEMKRKSVSCQGKPYSPTTLNRFVMYASAACGLATKLGLIDKNPLRFMPKNKEYPRDRVLTPEESTRLLGILKSEYSHLYPAILFASMVPIRMRELVNLCPNDIDQIGKRIKIRNGTTKNGRGVWIPIPPHPAIQAHFASIPKEASTIFYRQEKGQYLSLGDFKKSWKSALGKSEISDFRRHDLRHIAATMLVNAGTPEQVVREIANWKTDMLRRYYSYGSYEAASLVKFPDQESAESPQSSQKCG